MSALGRASAVDALVEALRGRILDGDLPAGTRLPERELTERHGVARHTLRAALRALAADGLVSIEPNRGASVARLAPADVLALYELRAALELEAAHLALERNGGRLPEPVHAAVAALRAACAGPEPSWRAVIDAHGEVHRALVRAARAPRIERAHAALTGEMRLFLMQLRPHWSLERMAADHEALLGDLERQGPAALREHLRTSAAAVIAGEREEGEPSARRATIS